MSHLLDTNVISELRKPASRVDHAVRSWVTSRAASDLYLSAITVLEVEVGIGRVARRDKAHAARLQSWLDDNLVEAFAGRILPVDVPVARRAARLHVPDPRPERDALIAATASTHGPTVATRNVKDFEDLDLGGHWSVGAARLLAVAGDARQPHVSSPLRRSMCIPTGRPGIGAARKNLDELLERQYVVSGTVRGDVDDDSTQLPRSEDDPSAHRVVVHPELGLDYSWHANRRLLGPSIVLMKDSEYSWAKKVSIYGYQEIAVHSETR